ncbi:hypothetical protein [Anaerobacillus arseniciselenatis]|uniref:hypothetical protein n=1 Tax=Anaerobacillus arseniciselenatis TaxID=85682 RepID=UPI0014726572|nr:hypothetical protein [Anaerobacillus arseniciselenatis]
MKLFRRKKISGAMGMNGKVNMQKLEERQWVLNMFQRKGYIVDRNSMKEGK